MKRSTKWTFWYLQEKVYEEITIARHARQTSKMKPGRAQAGWTKWISWYFQENVYEEITIARHAGQNSKMNPGRAQA